jgi:hypothetical protein
MDSYLLPAAYPEGNPQHPSYGEGDGVIAGACVTALKALFNESSVIANPVVLPIAGILLPTACELCSFRAARIGTGMG